MTRHHLNRGRNAVGLTGLLLLAVGCSSNDNTQAPIIPPPDTAPPIAPSMPAVSKSTEEGYAVAWTANTESDLAGYRVYVYEPDPTSESAYRLLNPDQLITRNRFSARVEANVDGSGPSELFLRVTAVDQSGNESSFSPVCRVSFSTEPPPLEQDPNADEDGGGTSGGSTRGHGGSTGTPGKEPSDDPSGQD